MVRISEGLIRKRAEHNECIISTLEEISLHQQDIEKIEYLDKWCKELKILYLQSNLIPKIENVSKLKKLEYLNLALNNVEKVENLEGCESLKKLDLTVNFVGELTSVECLKNLCHFTDLYLTGNPCCEYDGYREYVIAALPQLRRLHLLRPNILEQQGRYKKKRLQQREREESGAETKDGSDWYTDTDNSSQTKNGEHGTVDSGKSDLTEEEQDQQFWEEKTAYTPESRVRVHEHMQKVRQKEEKKTSGPEPVRRERRLQTEDGRMLNVNEPKVDFSLQEDIEGQSYVLDVAMFKHMDTSLCDVDVQPTYVRVTLKGKVLQLVLQEEVKPDSSRAQRSQTTGHLLVTMPKAHPEIMPRKLNQANDTKPAKQEPLQRRNGDRELLEVDPSSARTVDLAGIVSDGAGRGVAPPLGTRGGGVAWRRGVPEERPNSDGFVDDPEVPPLM